MKKKYADLSRSGYRRRQRVRLLKIFALAVVLCVLLSVFAIYIVKNMGKRPVTTTAPETTAETTSVFEAGAELSGNADFLLVCVADDGVVFAALLNTSLDERLFTVRMLRLNTECGVNGETDTLSGHYLSGGSEKLSLAVSGFTGREIDRYAVINEMNFVKAIKALGNVDVYIEENIKIDSNEVSIDLEKGLQSLDYNILLNYMKYASSGDKLLKLQAETICCMFESYFTESNARKGESLFTTLINLMDSNINAYDYISKQSIINSLIAGGVDFVSAESY